MGPRVHTERKVGHVGEMAGRHLLDQRQLPGPGSPGHVAIPRRPSFCGCRTAHAVRGYVADTCHD